MGQMEILRKLFDDKILVVIGAFLDNPDRKFSLTQIASMSGVNISTTFRIIEKIVDKGIVEVVQVGKSKFYRLKHSKETLELNKMLRKDERIQEFVEKLKRDFRVKKVILEAKTSHGAKILIVGDFLKKEKIISLSEGIRKKYNYRIQFVEISEKQFTDMEEMGLYSINKKIIWERD